jgi:hypothetical protein
MGIAPVIWYLIPCKNEPTIVGSDPSVHRILFAVRPSAHATGYPVWLRTFFAFALISDGQGICEFNLEVRMVTWDDGIELETPISESERDTIDLGNNPLRFRFLSLMMPSVKLPLNGVYRLYLMCNGQGIGFSTILAR